MPPMMHDDDFYAAWADHYDEMTRWQARWQQEHEMLRAWQQRFGFGSALDVACGTGLHALILADLGVRSTGLDASAAMLAIAAQHATRLRLPVTWIHSRMQNMQQQLRPITFDVVFCLGNSLPHLLTKRELRKTLSHFYRALNRNGLVVIQLLNYRAIVRQRQRILAVNRQGPNEFIRFYDFHPRLLHFNILHIDWSSDRPQHRLHSTLLHPYFRPELEEELSCLGFRDIQAYGDMHFHPFDEDYSTNLVLTATKSSTA